MGKHADRVAPKSDLTTVVIDRLLDPTLDTLFFGFSRIMENTHTHTHTVGITAIIECKNLQMV